MHNRDGDLLPFPFLGVFLACLDGLGGGHSDEHKTDPVVVDVADEEEEPRVFLMSSAPVFATSFSICIPAR